MAVLDRHRLNPGGTVEGECVRLFNFKEVRVWCSILFLLAALASQGQPGPIDQVKTWIDSLENQAILCVTNKSDSAIDVMTGVLP